MDLFVRRYRIPGGVGMNHSICCEAGIFPWGATKKGQIFWQTIKLVLSLKLLCKLLSVSLERFSCYKEYT